jgi:tagatose-1,6-bisphosphate aldolase non-catalytic subunit AgaZ/GatZ
VQHAAVRDGRLRTEPVALLRESVRRVLERYSIAAGDTR